MRMSFSGDFAFFRYRPAAVLKITGPDSQSFLQGQFTQELRGKHPDAVAYGLWLNQKGKVLADSFVLRESVDSWWVLSLLSTATALRERLEAYLIADEVEIIDVTEGWEGVMTMGEEASARLSRVASPPPENAFSRVSGGFVFRGKRMAAASWEWLLPLGRAEESLRQQGEGKALTVAEVEFGRIQAGIPAIPRDIGPGDLPNEGGLDQSAISYTKGCYLGQEVMARLKTMGQVRRRLRSVRISGKPSLSLPAELWCRGKKVGDLRSLATDETSGTTIGLAMISLVNLGAEKALSLSVDGPTVVDIQDFVHD